MATVLRVLPKGSGMVCDYAAMAGGNIRYHGWDYDHEAGDKVTHTVTGKLVGNGAFSKQDGRVVTLPVTAEYIRHLQGDPRRGQSSADLWPADEATAKVA